jgi:pimeloyl-ACP methyl ester carboxylesterase
MKFMSSEDMVISRRAGSGRARTAAPIVSASIGAILAMAIAANAQAPAAPASTAAPKIQLTQCAQSGELANARCGKLDVFENRAAMSGRKIPLTIVVLPATGKKAEPDPVFYLPGGPGYGAADSYLKQQGGGNLFGGMREKRDVVYVDYRGTGRAQALPCPIYGADPTVNDFFVDPATFLGEKTAACREQLSKDADLTQYTTPNIVDDLEDVRAALGYEQINLYGISYGTRVGMIYLRRHPEHLRSVILEAVEPPMAHTPLYVSRGMQHALDRLMADCGADTACNTAFPKLKADFDAVLDSIGKAPAKFEFTSANGKKVAVELSRRMFIERMIELLYNPGVSRILPFAIHQAANGDFSAYAAAIERLLSGNENGMSRGMYLAVQCSEDVAWISDQDAARETSGTLLGMSLIDSDHAACKAWPHTSITAEYTEPVTAIVPVLLLSGDLDPITPSWMAREAVKHLPNGLLTVNPAGGHGTKSRTCQIPLIEKFIEQGNAKSLDLSCVANSQRPAFVTDGAAAARMLQF